MSYVIKCVRTTEKFHSLEDQWKQLEKSSNNKNITSSFDYQITWWDVFKDRNDSQFGYKKELRILLLYKSDQLIGIAPFVKVTRRTKFFIFIKTIEFIGQQWAGCFIDFIGIFSKDEVKLFINWLYKNDKFDYIYLSYIPEFTKNFNLENNNCTVLSACPEIYGENYLDIRKKNYSKNLKHKLNRIRNKMNRENIYIEVKIIKGTNILKYFNNIINISESKKISNKHTHYDDTDKREFMMNIIYNFSQDSNCIFLKYKKSFCAYNWGLNYNNKYYAIDAAYSRGISELGNLSLGNIAYDEVLKNVFLSGINCLCFGTGIDSYKFRFTKKIVKIHNYFMKGNTFKAQCIYNRKLELSKNKENKFLAILMENLPNYDTNI